jgi:hypothetical protein
MQIQKILMLWISTYVCKLQLDMLKSIDWVELCKIAPLYFHSSVMLMP